MEKISNIVRGSSRVGSVDMKNAAPVRSGVPTFGRPTAATSNSPERGGTTASKAAALNAEMLSDRRSVSQDKIVQNMADQFFMGRIRRPDEETSIGSVEPGLDLTPVMAAEAEVEPVGEVSMSGASESGEADTSPYVPRGSFVDVRA